MLSSAVRIPRRVGRVSGVFVRHLRQSDLRPLLFSSKKPPYGFEHFYPKEKKSESSQGDKNDSKPSDSKPSGESPSSSRKENPFSWTFESKKQNSGSGGHKKSSGKGGGSKKPPYNDLLRKPWLTLLPAALIALYFSYKFEEQSGREISFQTFVLDYLAKGRVESITVMNKEIARVTLTQSAEPLDDMDFSQSSPSQSSSSSSLPGNHVVFSIGSVDSFERKLDNAQRELGIAPSDFVPVKYSSFPGVGVIFSNIITIALPIAMLYVLFRAVGGIGGGGGSGADRLKNIFQIGKANPVVINKGEKVKTTFKDVAGLKNAKVEVSELIQFLRDKEKFTRVGAKIPKGALLVGPPGTGKTLLAKAVAGESDCPFFSMSGSDFIEMFVGVGPSRVRDLFSQARANAPCIIFIDEIDAVGRARGKGGFSGGNDERESTLNQLLVEMDGFSASTGIVVLAGTNRADILDKALLRPGRFDRQIMIDLPDIDERAEIFMVHLKPLTLAVPANAIAAKMAALSPGFSGADIANVCNEAAIVAARQGKKAVGLKDFEDAQDRVIAGLEKSRSPMTQEEKKIIAYHEAGHAVTGWFLKYADPLLKVTVIPRTGGTLGFAQYLPKELTLFNMDQLIDRMCMTLGGRVSEVIFFNHLSTGASNDLEKVTELAYNQVKVFGMSDKVGHVSFPPKDQDFSSRPPYSDALAKVIDEEARKIIENAYERTMALLQEKKKEVELVAQRLLEVETITHDDIVELLGPRPHQTEQYKRYVKQAKSMASKYGTDDPEEIERLVQEEGQQATGEESSSGSKTEAPGGETSTSESEETESEGSTTENADKKP